MSGIKTAESINSAGKVSDGRHQMSEVNKVDPLFGAI